MTSIRILGAVAMAGLATLLVGCGQRSATPSSTPAPTTSSVATATITTTPRTPPPTQPRTRTPSTTAAPVLQDGRYPAFVIAVDPKARTLTFDVIQFLTGAQADEAYRRDHPGDGSTAPDPFYIVNANPLLRTLPVRADAEVAVLAPPLSGTTLTTITPAQLPGYFASMSGDWGKRLWPNPFWLTVRNNAIVTLQEQYLP